MAPALTLSAREARLAALAAACLPSPRAPLLRLSAEWGDALRGEAERLAAAERGARLRALRSALAAEPAHPAGRAR